jgi:hypothetical protein
VNIAKRQLQIANCKLNAVIAIATHGFVPASVVEISITAELPHSKTQALTTASSAAQIAICDLFALFSQ